MFVVSSAGLRGGQKCSLRTRASSRIRQSVSRVLLDQRGDVHGNAKREGIERAVNTSAVSRTQIERACQVVVESEIDSVVSGQACAAFRRTRGALATTEENLLRPPGEDVVAGSRDTEFVAQIEFGPPQSGRRRRRKCKADARSVCRESSCQTRDRQRV